MYLNIQNAYEQSQKVTDKLDQLFKVTNTEPNSNGKIVLGTGLLIDKDTLVSVAKTELKAEGNKLAELIKKL